MANSIVLKATQWRCIGPFRGGRVVAVAGDSKNPLVFYFGATAGGVWKTTDAGMYWTNVSDGFFRTAAVGAIAVSDSDPNVIYAGMGEACIRHDSSHGDGVYRSSDGGNTWTHLGLEDTRRIARIRIHPTDPDLVYVAALGHAYGPNEQRGVFRSRDGGNTWEQVLKKSERAGAIDLSMDATNPRILYASIFQVVRRPWTIESGGPESGLWRSTDGGDTWVDITSNPGFIAGSLGRIGIAASPARPGRIWAIVEARDGALLRSDDWGDTWEHMSGSVALRERGWYYNHLFADTQDPETCYVQSLNAWKSIDGGRTWVTYSTPHGDHHDLWIDPNDNQRIIEGSDGGASVTLNGGGAWSSLYNQPTASLFHVDTDTNFPYRIYGTQMDNTSIVVPSRSDDGAISWKDCYPVGSSESGYIAVRPDNPNIVYSGALGSAPGGGAPMLRFDQKSGHSKLITVWPEVQSGAPGNDAKYRFFFTFPIVLSPHDPDVLYTAAECVFRSYDEGQSWEIISPDLTRNDVEKTSVRSGGEVTKENAGPADYYSTIYAFAESPVKRGVLWAGSDDGLIHLSQDNGKTWQNVTPETLENGTLVSTIEASPHDAATAYAAATRFQWDDFRPMVYATHDAGHTWRDISHGIPDGDFARVIREDPKRKGLLYLGTETGVFVSFDGGASWDSLQGNLPAVPIYDLAIKDDDLIAATHGRSFWVLDDLTVLQQSTETIDVSDAYLFQPRDTYRPMTAMSRDLGMSSRPGRAATPGINYHRVSGETVAFYNRRTEAGTTKRVYLDAGENPPSGLVVNYFLRDVPQEEIGLEFLKADDTIIAVFNHNGANGNTVPAKSGMNQFVWDLSYADRDGHLPSAPPIIPPGSYKVRLKVGDSVLERAFTLLKDPRLASSSDDLEEQSALILKIRAKLVETAKLLQGLREVGRQVTDWTDRARTVAGAESVIDAATDVLARLDSVEQVVTKEHLPNKVNLPPACLDEKLAQLTYAVATSGGKPTSQSYQVLDDVSGRIDEQIDAFQQIRENEIRAFLSLIQDLDVPLITP